MLPEFRLREDAGVHETGMKSDDLEQLRELVAFLKENDVAEFDLDRGELKVRLKFASAVVQPVAPAASGGLDLATMARLLQAAPAAHMPAAAQAIAPVAAAHAAPEAQAATPAAEENLHIIKSPMVGTFYESPSPGSSPFVASGDRIEKGQIVCIVEAMKLMNEIEADAGGEIVKRLVTNGQPVEYGQPLFAIRTA